MNDWIARNRRAIAWVAVALAACMAAVVYFFNPAETWWMPRCLWLSLTGWRCPSCGVMRATHQLMHGHFLQAVAYNWWLLLSVPLAVAIVALAFRRRLGPRGELWLKWLIIAYVSTYFIWWLLRNLLNI